MDRPIRTRVAARPVAAFVALTYLLSWLAWAPIVAGVTDRTTLFIVAGGFGPLVAAAVVTWVVGDSLREWAGQLLRWRVPPRYWAVAFLLPPAAVLGASGVHVLFLGGRFDPEPLAALVLYPLVFLQVFLVGGGNEELGWRGFALPRLQARYSALVASLVVGVVWAAWHLPLFLVAGSSQAGDPVHFYVLSVVALSVVFTWLYNATGGSVLVTMALHASVNTGGLLYLAGGGAALETALANGLYAAAFVVVALVVLARYGPARLGRPGTPAPVPERRAG
jgi:membrane protease YdiL (CAAX protease family)